MINNMDMEKKYMKIKNKNIRDSFNLAKNMEKVFINGQMDLYILESLSII